MAAPAPACWPATAATRQMRVTVNSPGFTSAAEVDLVT
jgi:hypothetical protein